MAADPSGLSRPGPWPEPNQRIELACPGWERWLRSRIEDRVSRRLVLAAPNESDGLAIPARPGQGVSLRWTGASGVGSLETVVERANPPMSSVPTWHVVALGAPDLLQRRRHPRVPVLLPA